MGFVTVVPLKEEKNIPKDPLSEQWSKELSSFLVYKTSLKNILLPERMEKKRWKGSKDAQMPMKNL